MAFQMRSLATFRLVNFLTGLTPGRLFQIASNRWLLGPIRSANCTSLVKTPTPVSRAAFREAWMVMLFSASIVKCFILLLSPWRGNDRGDPIHHSGWKHKQ